MIIPCSACFLAPQQVALSQLQGLGPLLPCRWSQDWSKGLGALCKVEPWPSGAPLRGVCEPAPLLRAPPIHPKSVAQGVQLPDPPVSPQLSFLALGLFKRLCNAPARGISRQRGQCPSSLDGAHRACRPWGHGTPASFPQGPTDIVCGTDLRFPGTWGCTSPSPSMGSSLGSEPEPWSSSCPQCLSPSEGCDSRG